MSRDTLHDLVDRIAEDELPTALRFLEYLATNPAYRAALSAPPDDEQVTEADAAAIARARDPSGIRFTVRFIWPEAVRAELRSVERQLAVQNPPWTHSIWRFRPR